MKNKRTRRRMIERVVDGVFTTGAVTAVILGTMWLGGLFCHLAGV